MKSEYFSWVSKNWDELHLFHIMFGNNPFGLKFDPIMIKEYRELVKMVKQKELSRK